MDLGRILGGFCADLGGLIDAKPNKSEGIRANPHAYNIYYKTALPVPCTHRFLWSHSFIIFSLFFLLMFFKGFGEDSGRILEAFSRSKPIENALKNGLIF